MNNEDFIIENNLSNNINEDTGNTNKLTLSKITIDNFDRKDGLGGIAIPGKQHAYTVKLDCKEHRAPTEAWNCTKVVDTINYTYTGLGSAEPDCCTREETNCFVGSADNICHSAICRSVVVCIQDDPTLARMCGLTDFMNETKPFCAWDGGVGTFSYNYGNACNC